MNYSELVLLVEEKAFDGKSYGDIIKILKHKGISKDDLDDIKSTIDDYLISYELAKLVKAKALNFAITGLLLFLIGTAVTIFTYYKMGSHFVLAYGAILSGLGVFVANIKTYRSPLKTLVPKKQLFKRKY